VLSRGEATRPHAGLVWKWHQALITLDGESHGLILKMGNSLPQAHRPVVCRTFETCSDLYSI